MSYETIQLTHAGRKNTVYVIKDQIAFWNYSEEAAVTYVFCGGQNVFPALESPEEIEKILNTVIKPTHKEKT